MKSFYLTKAALLLLLFTAGLNRAFSQAETQNPGGAAGTFWKLKGNANTLVGTNFLGTTDAQPFMIKVNDQKAGYIDYASPFNTGFGYQTLKANTTGARNTATGYNAASATVTASDNTAFGAYALQNNTYSQQNTAVGSQALFTQSFANGTTLYSTNNVAVGFQSLYSNQPTSTTNGRQNVAVGDYSMFTNSTGRYNTAIGYNSLYSNSSAHENTAVGHSSFYKITGSGNTGVGYYAGYGTITGSYNTALGYQALYFNSGGINGVAVGYYSQFYVNNQTASWDNTNTSLGYNSLRGSMTPADNIGVNNTAIGKAAMITNSSGGDNTAVGMFAINSNTTGHFNTATGSSALVSNQTGGYNSAFGAQALYSNNAGSYNTAVGYLAGYTTVPANANLTGGNNTFVGYNTGYPNSTQRTNATAIGYNAKVNADNAMVLGGTGADLVNVGIGVTAPLDRLHVVGSIRMVDGNQAANKVMASDANGTARWENLSALGGSGWGLTGNAGTNSSINFVGTTDTASLTFRTQNIEKMRIVNSTGYLGIGVTGPLQRLHVLGNVVVPNSNAYMATSTLNPLTSVPLIKLNGLDMYIGENNNSNYQITHIVSGNTAGSNVTIDNSAGTSMVYARNIDSYVGIGITSPLQRLHVVGNVVVPNTNAYMATSTFNPLTSVPLIKLNGLDMY
ncbi:MAG: hypothetical protein V4615_09285, partial [Bacteroidota bacterium]